MDKDYSDDKVSECLDCIAQMHVAALRRIDFEETQEIIKALKSMQEAFIFVLENTD